MVAVVFIGTAASTLMIVLLNVLANFLDPEKRPNKPQATCRFTPKEWNIRGKLMECLAFGFRGQQLITRTEILIVGFARFPIQKWTK